MEPERGNPLRDNSEQAQNSHIDLCIQGEPEQSPDNEDQEKTSSIKLLVKLVLESPNGNQMIEDLFPKNDEYQDISEDFRNIVEEKGNIEAHEMFMITDAIQYHTLLP